MPDSVARKAFPAILTRYMERDNLSQVDISKRLKVSKQTVSDWVSGKKFPRVDRMQQLANLFGVLMSEMYTPTDDLPASASAIQSNSLTEEENHLVDLYRSADDRARREVLWILEENQQKDTYQSAI